MTTTRRLAAILAADVAGYSRLMGADEVGTLEALKAHRREVIDPAIAANHGRIVKTTGDGLLAEFASAVDAVTCAMSIQEQMTARDGDIRFRIGINIGDIISEGDDIFGDGVNVAARVENECEPGGVCLSDDAHRQVAGKTKFTFDDIGERALKNIARPVRLFASRSALSVPSPRVGEGQGGGWRGHVSLSSQTRASAGPGELPLPDKPSIAVLPFQNMSGDPEQEYFADGMVEEIITALSRNRGLFVIARNSSFTYKGKAVDIRQVGRELGVRYVLEGSVRRAGGKVRITGQLIDATSNSHVWADKYDGAVDDIFDLQDQVASSVVTEIAPHIERAAMERARRKLPGDLNAYDLHLKGLAAYQLQTKQAVFDARDCWLRAMEIDPDFALPYAELAILNLRIINSGWSGTDPESYRRESLAMAQRAIVLDRQDPRVLARAGVGMGYGGRDTKAGLALLEESLKLDSNSSAAWGWSGNQKLNIGEFGDAIERAHRAIRLSPRDAQLFNVALTIAFGQLFTGQYEEALSWARRAVDNNPNAMPLRRVAIVALVRLGRLEEARAETRALLAIFPQSSITRFVGAALFRPQDTAAYVEALRLAGHPE